MGPRTCSSRLQIHKGPYGVDPSVLCDEPMTRLQNILLRSIKIEHNPVNKIKVLRLSKTPQDF